MNVQLDPAPGAAAPAPALADTTPETTAPENQSTDQQTAEQPQESPEDRAAKALKAMQRRVDRLTRDRYAERARAEQLERERDELRQRQTQQPDDNPQPGQVDVEERVRQGVRETVEAREIAAKVRTTLEAGAALEGFDDAVNTAIEDLELMDTKGRPTPHLRAILEADAPHELLHHIGTNPDVAESLTGLSPTQFARKLLQLEIKLQASAAPKASNAPKPLAPVKGASPPTQKAAGDMSDAEWYRQRKR